MQVQVVQDPNDEPRADGSQRFQLHAVISSVLAARRCVSAMGMHRIPNTSTTHVLMVAPVVASQQQSDEAERDMHSQMRATEQQQQAPYRPTSRPSHPHATTILPPAPLRFPPPAPSPPPPAAALSLPPPRYGVPICFHHIMSACRYGAACKWDVSHTHATRTGRKRCGAEGRRGGGTDGGPWMELCVALASTRHGRKQSLSK